MFWPNCPCCGCVVASDDFNRSDTSSIGASWTEAIGNWEIVSNTLRCAATIASNSYAYMAPAEISTYLQHAVECDLKSSSNGDEIGIVFLHGGGPIGSDAEKTYARLIVGSSASLQLFASRNTGGFTPTIVHEAISREISVTASSGAWHNLRVCYNYDESIAVYLNGEMVLAGDKTLGGVGGGATRFFDNTRGSSAVGGPWIGSVSGTPEFDDFVIEKGERRTVGFDSEWSTVTDNEGCVCECCEPYSVGVVLTESCDGFDGNWHKSEPSTATLTSSGGRWVASATGTNVLRVSRCFVAGDTDTDIDIYTEMEIDWDSTTDQTSLTIGIWAPISGFAWINASYRDGTPADQKFAFGGGSSVVYDATTPAKNDVIGVRVYYDGSGYTGEYYLNGSAIYSQSLSSFNVDAAVNVAVLVSFGGDNASTTKTMYCDNIVVENL